jgi:hypothetical protein
MGWRTKAPGAERNLAIFASRQRRPKMATRERRLAEFDGNGEPPPDQPVQVLCEDHSGTYQLPFACRFVDGEWRNHESGGAVEATVVGWRLNRR